MVTSIPAPLRMTSSMAKAAGVAQKVHYISGQSVAATNEALTGDRYEGELVRGKRQGNGKSVTPTGHVYEGMWENNQKVRTQHDTTKFTQSPASMDTASIRSVMVRAMKENSKTTNSMERVHTSTRQ